MADVTREIKNYLSTISLTSNQKDKLRTSREALANEIKDNFIKKGFRQPIFRQQGSFDMGTIITPIDGEYDLDYGVYLQGYSDNEDEWPSTSQVHNWIINAVKDHTTTPPENKKTCVRVIFKGQYHIDLPSYIESTTKCKLSHLDGWVQSQPKDITSWFQDQIKTKGEELRDVVKILKGWADFQSTKLGKMPSGLILTILAANSYTPMDRLDGCVYETVKRIWNKIKDSVDIINPVDSKEKVSDRISDSVKKRFQLAIKQFSNDLEEAIFEDSFTKSAQIWIKEFGDRFPVATDPDAHLKKNIKKLSSFYESDSTIKPWGYKL